MSSGHSIFCNIEFDGGRAVVNDKVGWYFVADGPTDLRQWVLESGYMEPEDIAIKLEPPQPTGPQPNSSTPQKIQ